MDAKKYKAIAKWAPELDGVFTLADLKVALDENAEPTLYRTLAEMVSTGILIKIKRGIYVTPEASLKTISSRIEPTAYISMGTVLADNTIIGSIPARRVQAVKVGRPRTYACELGTIEHLSINPRLYFGFSAASEVRIATPEKAFLDVCYFTYRGRRFSFTNLTIRMNAKLKKEADELFTDLGLNLSTAFNMFVRQAIRVQGLPFDVTREQPNTETLAAMRETELIASGKIPAKSFRNAEELFVDLGVSL